MGRSVLITALAASLTLSLGCPSGDTSAKAQTDKSPDARPSGPPPSPHGANPHLDPQLGAPPHSQPAATPPGPPRDVTPSGETKDEIVDGLKISVPTEWTLSAGSSSMRKAELTLPGPGGDAKLVVYRFPDGAGTARQNIDRWKGQVEPAEGSEAATTTEEINGLEVTSIDVRGRFAGQSMPGAPPQPPIDDARLFAAMIQGSGDPYYFKLVGPAATLDVWGEAWTKLLASLAPE